MKNEENMNIDPDLEARVVAWVAGEASPFEIAELERRVAETPELAIFKRRIEAVHGLVREAARPDAEPLRLGAERRAKLLAAIGVAESPIATNGTGQPAVIEPGAARRRHWYRTWQVGVGAAASVALGFFVLVEATKKTRSSSVDKAVLNQARQLKARANADGLARKSEVELPIVAANDAFVPAPRANASSKGGVDMTLNGLSERDVSRFREIPREGQGGGSARFGGGGGRGGMAPPPAASAAPSGWRMSEPATNPGTASPVLHYVYNQERGSFEVTGGSGNAPITLGKASAAKEGTTAFNGTFGVSGNNTYGGITTVNAGTSISMPTNSIGGIGAAMSPPAPGGADSTLNFNRVEAGANLRQRAFGDLTLGADANALAKNPAQVRTDGYALSPPADAIVSLSPFTVEASKDRGYYASNTLSGTRLNTPIKSVPAPDFSVAIAAGEKKKSDAGTREFGFVSESRPRLNTVLRDQASSITVMTKQELVDGEKTDADTRALEMGFVPGAPVPVEAKIAQSENELAVLKGEGNHFLAASATAPAPAETIDDRPMARPAPREAPSVEETSTAKEPVSTFSLHVSDVSFRLAQAALARGQAPDASQIRPEEIYNAFDYGDPSPATAEKIGARIEQSAHPFLQQRNLVRIAMKVPATGRAATQPLRLTVLLDTSGSMEREDRVTTVRRALEVLVSLLGPADRVTLVGFARQPRLLAENVAGDQGRTLLDAIARTPAEGGTNIEEALKLGGELARRHQLAGAQNRIVVLTDGAANLGDADPARLAAMVETLRQQGIAFDACGVGIDGLDDAILEPLTRKGDGRYYVLDSPEAADTGFARQLAGAFRPAAENVKLQVRFNPARVAGYRLIGFEQHRLRTEDFRNDRVDAAELAADEAAVALYQVEPLPQGEGELGEVFVRFRDPATGAMVERSWTMSYDAHAAAFDRATPSMQLAGAAALVAEKLRASPLASQFRLGDIAGVVNTLRRHYASEPRVQEFVTMYGTMRRMSGE